MRPPIHKIQKLDKGHMLVYSSSSAPKPEEYSFDSNANISETASEQDIMFNNVINIFHS